MLFWLINDCRNVLQGKVTFFSFKFFFNFKFLIPTDLTPSPSNANVLNWSKLDASVKDVTFIKKPPHLISKVKHFSFTKLNFHRSNTMQFHRNHYVGFRSMNPCRPTTSTTTVFRQIKRLRMKKMKHSSRLKLWPIRVVNCPMKSSLK